MRSLLAPWIGGASAPPVPRGVRSMLAPWMGGACVTFAPPPDPVELVFPGGGRRQVRLMSRTKQYDEMADIREIVEILAILRNHNG